MLSSSPERLAGLGYGVVEQELAQHWADRGSVRILAEPTITAGLNLVVHRDRMEHKPTAAVITLAQQLWHGSSKAAKKTDTLSA